MHSRLSDQIRSWHHASPSSSLQAAQPSCFILSSPLSNGVFLIFIQQVLLPPTSSLHSAPRAPTEQAQYMPVKIPASKRNKDGRAGQKEAVCMLKGISEPSGSCYSTPDSCSKLNSHKNTCFHQLPSSKTARLLRSPGPNILFAQHFLPAREI